MFINIFEATYKMIFFSNDSEPSSFKILCEYCPDNKEGFLPYALKRHIAQAHPQFDFQPPEDVDDDDIAEFAEDQSTLGSGK